jgi:hypothetical protein
MQQTYQSTAAAEAMYLSTAAANDKQQSTAERQPQQHLAIFISAVLSSDSTNQVT